MSGNAMTTDTRTVADWAPTDFKYMPMSKSDRGNKSIQLQNNSTKRAIKLRLPLLMTWGIQDYTDPATGESDGKFSITLNFPRDEDVHKSPETDMALEKLKEFENKIIDDAVKNSDEWFGESLPKEVIKHNYFSFIKYNKNKDTGKPDLTRPPFLKPKVPYYRNDGRMDWKIDLYSIEQKQIFPDAANPELGPQDFVPKLSKIICYIQCSGLWFGGKGWGLTWKMTAGMVNPQKSNAMEKKLPMELSSSERELFGMQTTSTTEETTSDTPSTQPVDTEVVDSDAEEPEPEPVPEPVKEVPKKKKVIKKVAK